MMKRFLTIGASICSVLIIAATAVYLWPASLVGHWEMETLLPIEERLENMSAFIQDSLFAEYELRASRESIEIVFNSDGTGWETSVTPERTTQSEFKWHTDGNQLIIEPWVLGQLGSSIYREFEIVGLGVARRLRLTDRVEDEGVVKVFKRIS